MSSSELHACKYMAPIADKFKMPAPIALATPNLGGMDNFFASSPALEGLDRAGTQEVVQEGRSAPGS